MPKVQRPAAGASKDAAEEGIFDGTSDRRSVLLALLDLVRTEVDLDSLLRRVVDLVGQAMAADRRLVLLLQRRRGIRIRFVA